METREIRVGVRDLLETLFHAKDLGGSFRAAADAAEGTGGHRLVAARRPPGYCSEVQVEYAYERAPYRLIVRGRIDGLLETDEGVVVEEIKTTYASLSGLTLSTYPVHAAQLQLYQYFWWALHPGTAVRGRLTYLNLNDLSERSFVVESTADGGRGLFESLAGAFLDAVEDLDLWRQQRDRSIEALEFPFSEVRPGQAELMDMVRLALEQERDLFVEAATGIGKTVAVLYPALKGFVSGGHYKQVFFLTAKTAGKEILRKTLTAAQAKGLHLRTVFIDAKERSCLHAGAECHPESCSCAVDYYDRAARAMPAVLAREMMTPEVIRDCAARESLCPFELSLDLALRADLVVADYNYVFDPRVYLKRFFLEGRRDYLFLIDEAHNLVTRGREMHSAALSTVELGDFRAVADAAGGDLPAALAEVDGFFDAWRREMQVEARPALLLAGVPELLVPTLGKLQASLEQFLRARRGHPLRQAALEFYFHVTAFARLAAAADRNYAVYVKEDGGHVHLRLFCLNPGPLLRRRLEAAGTAVFFSATLTPHEYFQELLGGGPDSLSLQLPSPFPLENRLYLHVRGIDVRYRARDDSAPALARCAANMVAAHRGNYLMFFPSYSYLQKVAPLVKSLLAGKAETHCQHPGMTERQKMEFIRHVTDTRTGRSNLGLAILGGLFGEGVDMPGEQLVGVLIVGLGLPTLDEEQELIRAYFEERNGRGNLYAFFIPGLIRVVQSAGRVFRSPEDRGVVLLVDERYADERYQEMLPPDWFMPGRDFSPPDYRVSLKEFWKDDAKRG